MTDRFTNGASPINVDALKRWAGPLLWLALALFALGRLAEASDFIFDVEKDAYVSAESYRPVDEPGLAFELPRLCTFSAYAIAEDLASAGVENIYLPVTYFYPQQPTRTQIAIGDRLTLDRYQYPPQFLLVPWLLRLAAADFFAMRSAWFVFCLLFFVVTAGLFALWLHRSWPGRAWLALPAVLLTPNTITTLHWGQAHLFIVVLCVLAFICIERRRDDLAGALLGLATVAKIFPLLVLIALALRRRWRVVGWSLGVASFLTVLTASLYGLQPFVAFFTFQLPRLMSGEAFRSGGEGILGPLTILRGVVGNLGVPGVPAKLALWSDPRLIYDGIAARLFAWLYLALLLIAIGLAERWRDTRLSGWLGATPATPFARRLVAARAWLALLILAQMTSHFLAVEQGSLLIIWLLCLHLPATVAGWRRLLWVLPALLLFSTSVPYPVGPPSALFDASLLLLGQLLVGAICLRDLLRYSLLRRDEAPA